ADASYFISLDVDGLQPDIMPACSDPEPGGLTFHEAMDLLRGLCARGRVVGMGVFEFVPEHDLHGLGARTVGRLLLGLINAIARARGDVA
ncbi:MAG: arginase family protein, partial [Armatimonadetes bacterium]|nr:arginase family protein [Armatimonadota bacterium]